MYYEYNITNATEIILKLKHEIVFVHCCLLFWKNIDNIIKFTNTVTYFLLFFKPLGIDELRTMY